MLKKRPHMKARKSRSSASAVERRYPTFEMQSTAKALHRRGCFELDLAMVASTKTKALPTGSRLSRVKALPNLALPCPLDMPNVQPNDDHEQEQQGDEMDGGDMLDQALESRLSPLQLALPDSPELKAIWLRSVASYERLRLRQAAKKLRLAHGLQRRGLVPIPETTPDGAELPMPVASAL